MHRRTFLASAASLAAPRIASAQAATLKFVPYTDLAVLDPIVTGNYSVRNHALMVWDTLYGVDETYAAQPQMVEGHTVENDGRLWTLTLREGLRFHDNTPVLARDAVASLRRWAVRDAIGRALLEQTDELSAPTDRTIVFRLKAPFPLLPFALGKHVGNVMVVMPQRLAETDPAKAVPEIVGSGPYRYLAAERLQGALNAYGKFDGYIPRPSGTPSLLAGPKIAHFARVEWHTIPDAATAVAALQKGEMDWVEQPSPDHLPSLKRATGVALDVLDPAGSYRYIRLNHLVPPFDDPAIRRAALAAVGQTDMMIAAAGEDPALRRTGIGFFAPGSPMASTAGMAALRDPPDLEAARRLLAATAYKGGLVRISVAATVAPLFAMGQVLAEAWKKIGFNVEFEALEIAAFLQRLAMQVPAEQKGWNASTDGFAGAIANDPVLNTNLRGTGRSGTFGWFDSPGMEALRNRFLAATELAEKQAICHEMQALCFQEVPYIPAGVALATTAYRRDLTPPLRGMPLFHGLRRG
jgi:peptide/nickel transport system substrate-binding protein